MWRKYTECFHSNSDTVWRNDNDNDKDGDVLICSHEFFSELLQLTGNTFKYIFFFEMFMSTV